MGWLKFWKRTKRQPLSEGELLDFIDRQQSRFLATLAEKDAQIRMVLEERFYHPLPAAPEKRAKSTVPFAPSDVEDVVHFSEAGDQQAVERDDQAAQAASRRLSEQLDAEINALAQEQAEGKAGEEPAEMLERVEVPEAT